MGLGWSGSYGATGAANALADILKQRELDKQRAFENDLKTRASDRADTALQQQGALQQDQITERADARTLTAREMMAPGSFMPEAQAQRFQPLLSGTLRSVPQMDAVGPDFQGPQADGTSPEQAMVGRPAGSFTLPTAKQAENTTDNERQAEQMRLTADGNQATRDNTAAWRQSQGTRASDEHDRKVERDAQDARDAGLRNDNKAWQLSQGEQSLDIKRSLADVQQQLANQKGAGGGGRPMPAGEAARISDLDNSIDEAAALHKVLMPTDPKTGKRLPGPTGAASQWGAAIPNWTGIPAVTGLGVASKQTQADIDRVKQVIGKAFEGGVLRKEDEAKYAHILPAIGDPDDLVETKLAGLDKALRLRRERELQNLGDAGYRVDRFPETRTAAPPASGGGLPPGVTVTKRP